MGDHLEFSGEAGPGDFIYVPSINACSMSANVLRRSFEHDKFSSRDALAAGKDLAKH